VVTLHRTASVNRGLSPSSRYRKFGRSPVFLIGILLSGGCSDSGGGGGDAQPQREFTSGCYNASLSGAGQDQFGCGLTGSLGDPVLDSKFQQEIAIQTQFWTGYPTTVYTFNECSVDNANAYSSPEGFIMFGIWLTSRTITQTGSDLPIAGILAHEWGHQLQFRFGWMTQTEPTQRSNELEADMWSGFYMAMAKSWAGPQINAYYQSLFSTGDYYFNSPQHHGTPNQRIAAGAVGLGIANQVITTRVPKSYQELHAIFVQEKDRIVNTIQAPSRGPEDSEPDGHGLDGAWVDGILAGTRSIEELDRLPEVPVDEQLALRPF
jgi:hypothetical protein